jgi:transposase
MAPRYRTVEREQLMLLPYDLKEWIPEDDIVHFVIEAVKSVPLGVFSSNENGTGDEQYHPHMMLALLLYCYSHGIFSSRRIERATWKDVAVRYICGNLHPDHDTVCSFRVGNEKAITEVFLQLLLLAKEMKVLKVGMVSIDGTKIKANASINKSVRYDRAGELEAQLRLEIQELMNKAAEADNTPGDEGETMGKEIQRLEELRSKMTKAREKLEERAKAKAEKEKKEYEDKVKRRDERKGRGKGRIIQPPKDTPEPGDQVNMSDCESRIMRKSKHSEYTQSYNAQAVVDAEGSMLVLGARVTNNASDANELALDVAAVPPQAGAVATALADAGYAAQAPIEAAQAMGVQVLVSMCRESDHNHRKHDWRPLIIRKTPPVDFFRRKAWVRKMMTTMKSERSKKLYKLRKQTVEPVFGIIKQALGFRQFLLRGLKKTNLEWTLVTCAYNLKRLAALR